MASGKKSDRARKGTKGPAKAKRGGKNSPRPGAQTGGPVSRAGAAEAGAAKVGGLAFPVVGIGASAGGLAAFEAFFSAMPVDVDPGMAFVLVQHLAPDHKSILTDLIRRYTRMQVFEVEDGMVVRPNCAYIIPPNRDMAFENGSLRLTEPAEPRGHRLPIDFFFQSLAQDQRERAICVILSGTGSDGTRGARAVKAEGGMVMVQSPGSTEYDGMPRSVIATGLVDYELKPGEMPAQLMAYASHLFGDTRKGEAAASIVENELKRVFVLLRAQTGHDFSQYKPNTLRRRVARRMALQEMDTIDAYLRLLRQSPAEVDALFRDLLIGVTNFFRDPEAFKALETEVLPNLVASKPVGSTIRVWTPGCATGEEAYSIAMLLQEQLETQRKRLKVQIFATDIDGHAIESARSGLFPASIKEDLTPERLKRFFTSEPDTSDYQVVKTIREMLVFSEQDVNRDPPFSRLDLISCRNLLIYMGPELQKKLIPLFHYALNPEGVLFLGVSETIGEFTDLFTVLDRKAKLYRRKDVLQGSLRGVLSRFLPRIPARDEESGLNASRAAPAAKVRVRELTEQALLQAAPAAALVSGRGDILYLHGRTGKFLEPAPGEAGVNNILKMARKGLQLELGRALQTAAAQKTTVVHRGVRVKTNGDFAEVHLTVRPVAAAPFAPEEEAPADAAKTLLFLVLLEEADPAGAGEKEAASAPAKGRRGDARKGGAKAGDAEKRLAALERELRAKEEQLRSIQDELESSNEAIRSSNEEMQSVNEELRCTNEELETSKEELQSVNEELATVNAELLTKVTDLSRANNDMNNLLAGTGIATIFVDHQLRILRFTPAATQIINLIGNDVGRPVGHIVSNLKGYDGLVADVEGVLDTLVPKELEVQTKAGQWYMLRILPYRTLDNIIEGAVITLVDITEQRRAREMLREGESLRRLAIVAGDANDAIIVQDMEGQILAWNPSAERLYGWSEGEALKMNIRELIEPGDRAGAVSRVKAISASKKLESYRARRIAKGGGIVEVELTATALRDRSGKVYAIATTERMIGRGNGKARGK